MWFSIVKQRWQKRHKCNTSRERDLLVLPAWIRKYQGLENQIKSWLGPQGASSHQFFCPEKLVSNTTKITLLKMPFAPLTLKPGCGPDISLFKRRFVAEARSTTWRFARRRSRFFYTSFSATSLQSHCVTRLFICENHLILCTRHICHERHSRDQTALTWSNTQQSRTATGNERVSSSWVNEQHAMSKQTVWLMRAGKVAVHNYADRKKKRRKQRTVIASFLMGCKYITRPIAQNVENSDESWQDSAKRRKVIQNSTKTTKHNFALHEVCHN